MTNTGAAVIDGAVVYAHFVEEPGRCRVRVSIDEFDRLGLCEGRRVRVGLPDREPGDLLVTTTARIPPFVWLTLVPLTIARAG